MNKSTLASILCIGIAVGACAREIIHTATPAAAFAQGGGRFKVVRVGSTDEIENVLNKYTAEGWRYVGPILGLALVFER